MASVETGTAHVHIQKRRILAQLSDYSRRALHGAPLTPWQKALLALCQRPVTLAELSEATRIPLAELSEALGYLCAHALLRRW